MHRYFIYSPQQQYEVEFAYSAEKKLRHREVKSFIQGHTASTNQVATSGQSDSKAPCPETLDHQQNYLGILLK